MADRAYPLFFKLKNTVFEFFPPQKWQHFKFSVCIRLMEPKLQTSENFWNIHFVYFVTFGRHMF